VAPELTAEQILEKSAAAYLALKSYEGTTTVNNTIDTGGLMVEQTATAKITFARPGKIRIEGKTAGWKSPGLPEMPGQSYAIVSDGKGAWQSWALHDNGAFTKTNLESGIAGMTGVAQRAPTVVPAALLKLQWGYPFGPAITSADELAGREKVGDNECYKIVIKSPIENQTYWIDTKTFLFRQLKEERDAKQMEAALKQMEGLSKNRGAKLRMPVVKVKSMVSLHTFAIDRINATVGEENFADPTKR
jgi:hypothetical protein